MDEKNCVVEMDEKKIDELMLADDEIFRRKEKYNLLLQILYVYKYDQTKLLTSAKIGSFLGGQGRTIDYDDDCFDSAVQLFAELIKAIQQSYREIDQLHDPLYLKLHAPLVICPLIVFLKSNNTKKKAKWLEKNLQRIFEQWSHLSSHKTLNFKSKVAAINNLYESRTDNEQKSVSQNITKYFKTTVTTTSCKKIL